jgi:hypothetical protein
MEVSDIETPGASPEGEREQLERALERALEGGLVDDVIVARSMADAQGLWEYRESVGEMLGLSTEPRAG